MRIERVDNTSATVVHLGAFSILISYSTPVAYCHRGEYFRTSLRHSVTTSKHINRFLSGSAAQEIPQERLNSLLGDIEVRNERQ